MEVSAQFLVLLWSGRRLQIVFPILKGKLFFILSTFLGLYVKVLSNSGRADSFQKSVACIGNKFKKPNK